MGILGTYLSGWRLSFRQLKLWGLLYFLNILFALVVSFPVFQFLNDKLSHSLELDKLLDHFDFTVFNDILNYHGDILGFVSSQGLITGLVYLLLSIFLVGGILCVFVSRVRSDEPSNFWSGGARYYWRILGLTILFLLLQALTVFLFFTLFNVLTNGGLERFYSERMIYQRAVVVFAIWSLVANVFWMVQDYAKVIMVHDDASLFASIGRAFKFVFKNFGRTFLLYLLNFLTFALVFWLYWRTPGANALALSLVIGQLFLLFRIGCKLLNLGTATIWYNEKSESHLAETSTD